MYKRIGWRPLPYISAYPASKAAISFFSDCLSDEFRQTNVRIQCLIPMLVATKVASYEVDEANNLFVVTPENYAKQAVRAIGRFEILTGCVQHDVQVEFFYSNCFGNAGFFLVFQTTLCTYYHAGCAQTPRSCLSENSPKGRVTSRY
ncbi:hypothetical protein ANCCAN_14247 [Ancylostoma caninum]|uniref:Uncharacterized protein n=1 Tax=Ancylostoma caninum TaxID=29170 RepID=A0A368G5W1_ANCCA|nr:hypothetical protein ANCCAN_14247 [Ancylostoma caninum]